jgi:hypothetical protein
MSIDLADDSSACERAKLLGVPKPQAFFLGCSYDGCGKRVLAGALDRRRQAQDFFAVHFLRGNHF